MTATRPIDWTKPVQVSDGQIGSNWRPVRVLATDLEGDEPIVVSFECSNRHRTLFRMKADCSDTAWQFRNTPAPPVPFEFTRWVNVRRRDDGTFHDGGQVYADADTAARGLSTKFVTVPVTIRGEWKDEESDG